MKISTLLKREPFKEIFEKTLSNFLKSLTGKNYKVMHYSIFAGLIKRNKDLKQSWLCNPLINSIFVIEADLKIFESINGEYNQNPLKPWRNLLQKAYLKISQKFPYSILLSRYVVNIQPPISDPETKLIIGGNNKIRMIDIKNKKVYVILKKDFNPEYVNREIYVRNNFSFIPTPKILEINKENHWYSEEYINGLPPNRLDKNLSKNFLNKSIRDIHKLLSETKSIKSLDDYLTELVKKIQMESRRVFQLSEKTKSHIELVINQLGSFLKNSQSKEIVIGYTHGDFHQGNILSDPDLERYWILDWEHSGIRQSSYDLFILLMESRIAKGFSGRFLKLFRNELAFSMKNIADKWPDAFWKDDVKRKNNLIIFLLEDLYFYLSENSNELFFETESVLHLRLKEYDEIIKELQKY